MNDAAITIRAAEPADGEGISILLGSAGTFEGTLQLPDMPVASRTEWAKVDPQACKLVAVREGRIVGWAGLHVAAASLRRTHARTLSIAMAPDAQGQGIGRQMMERLLHWADNWAGVLRIELMVQADNAPAIALYRSLGFAEEGRHRGYALKDGRYADAFSMARLHPAPPQLPAPDAQLP
jgi:putative acetyltransferase